MLLSRNIQQNINKWLLKDEIIVLNGPRQTGKTCLLKLLKNDLETQKIEKERIFYLNLEDIEILNELNISPKNIFNYIKIKNKKNYFLIDEIQYLDNPSNFLKYLYDEHKDKIKLIVTGSSSLKLKAKMQDSLAGRKIVFQIDPLCFEEFLQFKKMNNFLRLLEKIKNLSYLKKSKIPLKIQNEFKNLLDEYMLFGGMPKVVLTDDCEDKKILLKNYVNDYINKDVRYIGKIDNLLKFNQTIKIIANQIGNLFNINELSNSLNISRKEVENYLNLLEYTFVLYKLPPYYKNIRSQIIKMPKIYFFDLGIRNQILNNFVKLPDRSDNGNLFENFIFLELKKIINKENIYFYRTIHKAEIDFIFEKNGVVYPIETKYKYFYKPTSSRILINFCNIKSINSPFAYLVNLNLNKKSEKIIFSTFSNLSFENFNKK